METNARDVKGIWIPIEVWESRQLTAFEKVLLAEIDSLDNGVGCFKTNKNLSIRMMCSIGHLKNTLTSLGNRKWLKTFKKDGLRMLRTRFSRHRKGNFNLTQGKGEITPRVREKLPVSLSTIKTKNTLQLSDAAAQQSRASFGLLEKFEKDKSPAAKLCRRFYRFMIRNRLQLGKRTPNFRKWKESCELLIDSVEGGKDVVLQVMLWYFDHFKDQYVPTVEAMTTFCQNFIRIEKAMKRDSNGDAAQDEYRPVKLRKDRDGFIW